MVFSFKVADGISIANSLKNIIKELFSQNYLVFGKFLSILLIVEDDIRFLR